MNLQDDGARHMRRGELTVLVVGAMVSACKTPTVAFARDALTILGALARCSLPKAGV